MYVLSGLQSEDSIDERCRKDGIAQGHYYTWRKRVSRDGQEAHCWGTQLAQPPVTKIFLSL